MLWVTLLPWLSCAEAQGDVRRVGRGAQYGLPAVTDVVERCLLPGGAVVV
jgi:hypothetical protein